jgi:NADH-quinone oxidoreductase subunit L
LRSFDRAVVDAAVGGFGGLGLLTSRFLAWFDRSGIDRVVDGIGDVVTGSGRTTRKIQTGNVQTYLFLLVTSILILVVVFAR